MKKIIFTIAFIASGLMASAQVGIGNTNPKVSLHVTGTNDNGLVTGVDGVLVPRVNDADMSTATAGSEDGQLVYNTVAKAFYFWNAATPAWTAVGGASAAVPYQNIRGTVSPVNAATYTVLASDYTVITRFNSGVEITLPALTNTSADIGRTVKIINNNTAGALTFASPAPLVGNFIVNINRGIEVIWTGISWASPQK